FLSTKLRVTRDDLGKWEVYTSVDDGATFSLEGSVIDRTFVTSNWFGVYCRYTATRSDGFTFDDFKVEELLSDVTPPSLANISIVDEFTMEATFSEAVTVYSALQASNYRIKEQNEIPTAVSATALTHVFRLTFTQPFRSGRYTLIVNDLSDTKGNKTVNNELTTFYITPYIALKGDVVINEIFADPSPPFGLPSAEFVELWNTTERYILLKDWRYSDLTSSYTFLADTLRPNEHVILCALTDENLFKPYGKTIGLKVWPSLNNDKDKLSLIDPQSTTIDEVSFTDNWYKDVLKKQGGYSLELIDPKNKCFGMQNWQASSHSNGGTPGVENSVYRLQLNLTAPKVLNASILDETTFRIDFSKSIDSLSGALANNYRLNNGIGEPLIATPQSPDFMSVLVKLNVPLTKGQEYVLTVNNVSDCAGNLIDPMANTALLFMAKDIGKHDILISEILVNPKSDGVDFIEIYNATDHVLDLATLKLANIDTQGNIANIKSISGITVYIPSKAFWVLTTDIEVVKQHYEVKNPTHFTKMALPTYTNEKGTVILLATQGEVDRFDYTEKMHFSLLRMIKGVSLERISFQRSANEKDNFKSAAQASGFGTPTYRNSQEENSGLKNNVWLSSRVFSPEGDGLDDFLQIHYDLSDQDYVADVSVYSDKGKLVKKIVKNSTIPKTGILTWDGLNDVGGASKLGIYVIKFNIFTINGKSKSFEQTCVLAKKL
ncbi:MAG: lamin tail domain-containing protein, partial [Pedobacter sp.]|nr:lamin tail domain-containing protein [Pedobacter sp.]